MARSSSSLPKWCRIVRSNPAAYERDVFTAAPINSPRAAEAILRPMLEREETESFVIIALDAQHHAIALSEVTRGTVSQSLVAPRETFRLAIVLGASAIIVAHNHPSGDPTPSLPDRQVTALLVDAGRILDIPVHDHIIIGAGSRYTSFAEAGLLMNDPDLLSAAIAAAGLSARRFAIEVLDVDERNLRRWLEGERELQGTVRVVCVAIVARPALAAELAAARASIDSSETPAPHEE